MEKTSKKSNGKERKMRKIVLILSLILNILFADDLYTQLKGKKMFEDFDIKSFNKRSINDNGYRYSDKNEVDIDINKGFGVFWIDKIYPNPSLLHEYIEYFLNGKIKYYLLEIKNDGYKIIEHHFNEKYEIVQTIDYDKDYKMQLDDVLKVFKEKFPDVDLHAELGEYKDYKTVIERFEINKLEDLKLNFFEPHIFLKPYVLKYDLYDNDINKLKFPMKVYTIRYFTKSEEFLEDFNLDSNLIVLDANTGKTIIYLKYDVVYYNLTDEELKAPSILDK
jgi:hypothetical protein